MSEPLADVTRASLDTIVSEGAATGRLPSLAAAVFRRGSAEWETSVGEPHNQFRIGSISKTFTAVAVLQLRDEGAVALDDDVAAHLPDSPYGGSTIRGLLAHSSGMTAEPAGSWWERSPGRTWSELVEANTPPRSVFPAFQRYHYSNLGFALLGELVARKRGVPWWEALSAGVLSPLGLLDTTYHPRHDAAAGTSRHPMTAELMAEPAFDAGAMAPAGQLWSTVRDLALWGDFLVTGHPTVLSPSSLVEMRTVASGDPDEQHRGCHGLGLRLSWQNSGTLVGHTGSMPGFLAALFVDPLTRVGGVMLTNATTGVDPESFVVRLLQAAARISAPGTGNPIKAAAPAAAQAQDVAARADVADSADLDGDWYWGNTLMTLVPTASGFRLRLSEATRSFEAVGEDRYRGCDGYFAGEDLRAVRLEDGSVSHLEVVSFILTRSPYDPNAPIPGGSPSPLASAGG